jgi:hypothetical protein
MDRHEAGRALGLADADVLGVEETEGGTVVRVLDGSDRLVADDGVFALTDHPATAQLRRWHDEPEAAAPERDGAELPDGTAEDVLTWVGDDRARAAEALAAEEGRDHPRSTLVSKLRKLADA